MVFCLWIAFKLKCLFSLSMSIVLINAASKNQLMCVVQQVVSLGVYYSSSTIPLWSYIIKWLKLMTRFPKREILLVPVTQAPITQHSEASKSPLALPWSTSFMWQLAKFLHIMDANLCTLDRTPKTHTSKWWLHGGLHHADEQLQTLGVLSETGGEGGQSICMPAQVLEGNTLSEVCL